jgi:hypothetical protein
MKLRIKKLIAASSVWLMLVIASPSVQVRGQSDGPLKGKLDVLKTKLEDYLSYSVKEGEGPDVGTVRFEAVSFDSCRIAWKSSMETGHSAELPQVMSDFRIMNQVSVDLSSIDSTRTRIYVVENMLKRNISRALVLELKIHVGSQGFKHQIVTTSASRRTKAELVETSYAFFFETRDQSVAEEVAKAFADASNLCRVRVRRSQ